MAKAKKEKKVKFPPLPKLAYAEDRGVYFKCGHCGVVQESEWNNVDVSTSGGGCCHNEYCYCDWPSTEIQVKCPYCKVINSLH